MQNREEKDISWNDSQFTWGSNWTEGCSDCSCGRLLCKEGGCKEKVCTYTHNSDNDTKTRDPVRALNNSSKVKLMLGEVYSSGLSGGHAIQMASPAGRAEEEAECRDRGACNPPSPQSMEEVRVAVSICVCMCVCKNYGKMPPVGAVIDAKKKKKKRYVGRSISCWYKRVLNGSFRGAGSSTLQDGAC